MKHINKHIHKQVYRADENKVK